MKNSVFFWGGGISTYIQYEKKEKQIQKNTRKNIIDILLLLFHSKFPVTILSPCYENETYPIVLKIT